MDISRQLVLDIECYNNYLLVMFKKRTSGEIMYFEKFNGSELNSANIFYIISRYTIITFNGLKYDKVILECALAGLSTSAIHKASTMLIVEKMQPWQVRKQLGIAAVDFDHIDLIEVAPLKASLKIYGGRIHCPRMRDLPLPPEAIILEKQLPLMRVYCENDLDVTDLLASTLDRELDLRIEMGKEYHVDLRSKSDAQIAEVVMKHEMKKKYNITPKRSKIEVGTEFKYKAPKNLEFETPLMKEIFSDFKTGVFTVGKSGHMELPPSLKNRKFVIGDTTYKIGIGGLHSCEKSICHIDKNYLYKDYDAAAFYPFIILNNKLTPKHLGKSFLFIFKAIVERRLKAKREGNTTVNESLKITINGTFGKFGSKWSFLYAPDLMMQVTITGQLTLLMLIERLHLAGVSTVSGNTDGIVLKILPEQEELVSSVVSDFEFDTDYDMESTRYLGLYSRDVNNYIAVAEKYTKAKGAYADPRAPANTLRINPTNEISTDAVKLFIRDKTPVEKTIKECKDVSKFVTIRTVNGGALKNGELIGKYIRWYYGKYELDAMFYKTSGNKVPRSDGAIPMMDLPNKIPDDMDYEWYIKESKDILKKIGYK